MNVIWFLRLRPGRNLMTPALHGYHLVVLLQYHVLFRVVEEERQVAVERGDAAGGPDAGRLAHVVNEALYSCVIGGVDALY